MSITYTIDDKDVTKKEYIEALRKKYMQNLPEGYSRREIECMKDNDLLDMDYFLNEF